jgi:hypothetical protein
VASEERGGKKIKKDSAFHVKEAGEAFFGSEPFLKGGAGGTSPTRLVRSIGSATAQKLYRKGRACGGAGAAGPCSFSVKLVKAKLISECFLKGSEICIAGSTVQLITDGSIRSQNILYPCHSAVTSLSS